MVTIRNGINDRNSNPNIAVFFISLTTNAIREAMNLDYEEVTLGFLALVMQPVYEKLIIQVNCK